jgi:integrase
VDRPAPRAAAARAAAVTRITFKEAAERFIELSKASWKNPAKQADQWESSLRIHAEPIIGKMDVADIDTPHLLKVLEPIWVAKHPTAKFVRQRIESVLEWATTAKYRAGSNPARFDGHLEHLLAKHKHKTTPRPALQYQEAHEFVAKLATQTSNEARALALVTYTGTRYIEAAAARWREFDLKRKVWTVPAERMKKDHVHEVPLSRQVIKLLEGLPGEHRPDDLVFPSRENTPVANSRVNEVLRDIGYEIGEASTHGFRSTLRTWVGDTYKDIKTEIAESVIAHDKRGKDQQTYERTRFLNERVSIMQAWADYLDAPPSGDSEHGQMLPLREAA